MTEKVKANRRRLRYERALRAQGKTVAEDMADLRDQITLGLLRSPGITPERSAALVEKLKAEGRYERVMRQLGQK